MIGMRTPVGMTTSDAMTSLAYRQLRRNRNSDQRQQERERQRERALQSMWAHSPGLLFGMPAPDARCHDTFRPPVLGGGRYYFTAKAPD